MSDKQRPNTQEYELLAKLAKGVRGCSKKHGPWRVGLRYVSDRTVNSLRDHKWIRQSRSYKRQMHYLHITKLGYEAYKVEEYRRLECVT